MAHVILVAILVLGQLISAKWILLQAYAQHGQQMWDFISHLIAMILIIIMN
jgi:heme/copper-type cytochrome/quinol oxidase subunit 2